MQSGKNKIYSNFRILHALHNLSERKKRRKTVTQGSRSSRTTVDWSLTTQIKNNGEGMLFSVEQAFVGRDEKRAPLKTHAWEATIGDKMS